MPSHTTTKSSIPYFQIHHYQRSPKLPPCPRSKPARTPRKPRATQRFIPISPSCNFASSTDNIRRKQNQPPKKPPSRTKREQQPKTQNGPKAPNRTLRSPLLPSLFPPTSDPRPPYREDAEAKKLEAARKKAEKDALLAEEERNAPSKPKNAKAATKKTRGLDLAQLDDSDPSKASPALNASGIENALDALGLTADNKSDKVDRHPERRFKAAHAAYEARRLPEMEEEHKGLRRNQRVEMVRKEFEKSPENPFNQVSAQFDSTREEIREMKERERDKTEARLVGK